MRIDRSRQYVQVKFGGVSFPVRARVSYRTVSEESQEKMCGRSRTFERSSVPNDLELFIGPMCEHYYSIARIRPRNTVRFITVHRYANLLLKYRHSGSADAATCRRRYYTVVQQDANLCFQQH